MHLTNYNKTLKEAFSKYWIAIVFVRLIIVNLLRIDFISGG